MVEKESEGGASPGSQTRVERLDLAKKLERQGRWGEGKGGGHPAVPQMWISTLFSARQNPSNSSGANGARQAHTFTNMFVWTCECERRCLNSHDYFAPLNLLLQRKINNSLEEPTRDGIQWHSVLHKSPRSTPIIQCFLSLKSPTTESWIMFVNVWVVFLLVI